MGIIDKFTHSRTYLVITILIILFSLLLMKACMKRSNQERFSNHFSYINGSLETNESKRHTMEKIPLKKGVRHENSCKSICLAQPECLEKNSECKSTYEANSNCYCSFQKVQQEGFSTATEYLNLQKTPNWSNAVSDSKMSLINNNRVELQSLQLENQDTISISGWFYVSYNPDYNSDTILLPIVEIVDSNKKNILSFYLLSDHSIVVRHNNSYDNGLFDVYRKSDTDALLKKPFHLVITYDKISANESNNASVISGYKVYKNGIALTNATKRNDLGTADSNLIGSSLIMNRKGVEHVYIQNLYIYSATLTQVDVNILYNYYKSYTSNTDYKNSDCIFNATEYLKKYPDLQEAYKHLSESEKANELKNHYILWGMRDIEKRSPCGNINPTCSFNAATYSSYYPDLQQAFKGDVAKLTDHYKYNGINEGRIVCKA